MLRYVNCASLTRIVVDKDGPQKHQLLRELSFYLDYKQSYTIKHAYSTTQSLLKMVTRIATESMPPWLVHVNGYEDYYSINPRVLTYVPRPSDRIASLALHGKLLTQLTDEMSMAFLPESSTQIVDAHIDSTKYRIPITAHLPMRTKHCDRCNEVIDYEMTDHSLYPGACYTRAIQSMLQTKREDIDRMELVVVTSVYDYVEAHRRHTALAKLGIRPVYVYAADDLAVLGQHAPVPVFGKGEGTKIGSVLDLQDGGLPYHTGLFADEAVAKVINIYTNLVSNGAQLDLDLSEFILSSLGEKYVRTLAAASKIP